MFKKLLLSSLVLVLTACSASPKYKISDEDAKKWIIEGNKVEQCLFPKEYKAKNFNSLSQEERYLQAMGALNTLAQVIGMHNYQLIGSDFLSKQYLQKQYEKFNHSNPISFDPKWCNALKKDYQIALKQIREQQKKQKAEELARRKQAAKEEAARKAFYATPEGQAYLARQQLIAQQQAMQAQMAMQQQQILQQQQELRQQQVMNAINSGLQSIANQMNQNTNMINSMTNQMRNSMPTYQYQAPSSTTCYQLMGGTVRCNHR
ncbi:DUF5358 family protein [Gallibacterium anatis]|uniref:DUF5358 family protein n=1 Tax=Gallibacterium anatis TaxID=750 RepID=UPI000B9FD476|nr:DUF5358 family protein [Gallibacterium anatis]WAX71295.1 DUF5358 family protein [Gallibacterium anatis]